MYARFQLRQRFPVDDLRFRIDDFPADGNFVIFAVFAEPRQRYVVVERLVLVPSVRLDGGKDVSPDAEGGERFETRLAVVALDGLEHADHALLQKVFLIAAAQKIRMDDALHHRTVTADQHVYGGDIPRLRARAEFFVRQVIEIHVNILFSA